MTSTTKHLGISIVKHCKTFRWEKLEWYKTYMSDRELLVNPNAPMDFMTANYVIYSDKIDHSRLHVHSRISARLRFLQNYDSM